MTLHIKRFDKLTTDELYRILKLRVDVFVVEQNCAYSELDDRDRESLHVWLEDASGIAAYLRVLKPGLVYPCTAIGRVIAARRREGLGTEVLKAGIQAAKVHFGASEIYLEAQTYARPFYEKQGFRAISEPFDEDGIEHIKMLLKL